MNPLSPTLRKAILGVLASSVLTVGTSFAAPGGVPGAAPSAVMNSRGQAANVELPSHAKANSGLVGRLGKNALSGRRLSLTLADGQTIEARLQRVAKDDRKGSQSWIGTFDDSPGSVLVLTRYKGVVTGFANYKEQVFELQPGSAEGEFLLFEVDNSKLPEGEIVVRPETDSADELSTVDDYGVGVSTQSAGGAVVQDVLVLYTANTASRYGQATIESRIQSAVEAANQAYLNSQINITLNPVGIQQTSVTEQSGMNATLNALQSNSGVARARDEVGADVVVLVSEHRDYCGLANLMTSNSTSFASRAFGVVASNCLTNQSLAHEIGHIQGVMHDRASSGSWRGVYPYSYGYRRCVSDGAGFRDIMSYSCSGAPRVLVFSNPNVTWNGYPAGISYESNPSNSAENARSMNNTANTVAAFRQSSGGDTPTIPNAPSSLSATASTSSRVSVSWSDNSNDETGFRLERSTNGVNYSEIATLGAGTTGFNDSGLPSGTTYYYRVRAYNSAGTSAYSNTDSATLEDDTPTVPNAPSALSANPASSSQVTVTWSDNSNNETGFRLERSASGGSFSQIATLGAGTTGYSDSGLQSGTTYYYRVRAYNSGGTSAYSNTDSATLEDDTPNPPNDPTDVRANDNANGSATVSWRDASSNEDRFEVARQAWDEQLARWSSRTTIASVQSGITSIVDESGTGRFRYTVRAVNSGGASGDAGPAETEVTDGSETNPGDDITLSSRGYKVKGRQRADLRWTGASSSRVDIFRDGRKITTTSNTGSYTDNINRRGNGRYTYQVCEAGTSVCSTQSELSFK